MVEGIWNKIIVWALLILFILIFFFAFYSKEGFMGKIGKLALAAERFLPVEPSKEVKQDESLPQATINTQKKIMGEISKYNDKENCLLEFSSLSGLGDYRMEVSNYEGKVISRIEKPVGKEGGIKINPIDSGDKELKICVINPQAFYDCYLAEKKDCTKILYNEKNYIELTKNEIIIDGNSYTSDKGILFKPTKDKICFIPVHKRWYSLVQVSGWCDTDQKTIDYNCLEKLKHQINLCSSQ